jgi:hypothetical protein
MEPLIISAPFGNYWSILSHLTDTQFTPTLGTFTWNARGFWDKPMEVDLPGSQYRSTIALFSNHGSIKSV